MLSTVSVWQNGKDSANPLLASPPSISALCSGSPLHGFRQLVVNSQTISLQLPTLWYKQTHSSCSINQAFCLRADRQGASAIATLTLRLPTFQTNSQYNSFCTQNVEC